MTKSRGRRFQVHYGAFAGEKGYVVVDTEVEPNYLSRGRRIVFTTDSRGDVERDAERRNHDIENPTVHPCCGCSCRVCQVGHNADGNHSKECKERFFGEVTGTIGSVVA